MFVERDQLSQHLRRELRDQDSVRRSVALECLVRHELRRHAFVGDFLGGLAEGQRFRLGEEVCHEQMMMLAERIQAFAETDEIRGNKLRPLVNQLLVGMLSIFYGPLPFER